jgi:hypothetical protein
MNLGQNRYSSASDTVTKTSCARPRVAEQMKLPYQKYPD